ncbi:bifunctional proline dehydrogenase/L-glutamate gamma-semialdehyde dehydrogenase [Luteolibacter sp. GHJ8]|uniref:L-glutamate gamma-semialdehyde dehydrogenase n=1 Tax=Luteolibacter rhizosphaerae TaxID=2989719 RepID=A0ABT3FYT2_9BACT|nr:bifunctional proline dehydrogenase/L-glutamate gamma-semialdehyde dehydrogenase [Luteolibacter rhizosphaerae]MCW1912389.1 bifunctional proline dehydrogenase/L-glutamate gamma-semialdehyde dehydrogenase [Luteolibacter rhizosphaerae]
MTRVCDHIDQCRQFRPSDDKLPALAIDLAAELLEEATRGLKWGERMQARQMAAMMHDAAGKAFTFAMADQVFRPPTASREAKRFRDLIDDYGVPEYLPLGARMAMRAGEMASAAAPEIVMPLVAEKMRQESSAVILPAEEDKLRRHLQKRRRAGMRMNLNQLGEAVLGEEEANHRLESNLARLADPDTDYISVKISAIFSQIHLVALEETLEEIKKRLRLLYRAAMQHQRAEGGSKFVNLDMEEYRDLRLTCAAFREVLDEAEFHKLEAGIVLQAYLPDAWPVQKELNAWALKRVDEGGAGIKIRIVKGANLAMEKVDAEIHDWPLAPYHSKVEVDANFKRMLHEGCKPENVRAVRLGVASHNLFDIAYGLLLRAREGVEERVEFEMLEGMANHQARTVRDAAKGLLLYAPVVKREDFHSAIAYLVRRLDENTSPENFLHDLFGMQPGDAAWERQKERFLNACAMIDTAFAGPQRVQDRTKEERPPLALDHPFHNEADTDWSLPQNVAWVRDRVKLRRLEGQVFVPLQVGGETGVGAGTANAADPSRPGVVAYRHALGGPADIERALSVAVSARGEWVAMGLEARAAILARVGASIAKGRGEAISVMVMDAGKSVMEADAELSEAIDFADYYARSLSSPGYSDGVACEPLGTVLVTPPWNFPYAIPCGGILAALVAGNTVILKPAPETVLTAWVMVNALWDAGVPKEVLQFLPCPDNEIGRSLVTDPRIGAVILTGAYETARMFLSWKPGMKLFAETSGKNALVITAAADPDLGVKDLVKSAFGHSGQKCSAASLAILEAELYDDPGFRRRLKDAAASLKVGASWNFDSIATPVIREPGDALMRALTSLDPGEEWLLKPEMIDGNPCLWSPGIKLGVTPDSWFRRTECFGPVLGLVRANDLDHAIRIQNDSDFGLTGGIHSLDPAEIDAWRERVEVGNAYINRPITGAIVQRQPFGGWKRSCFGPGAKAGGPNYVAQFATWRDEGMPQLGAALSPEQKELLVALGTRLPGDSAVLEAAAGSDAWWMAHEFEIGHDPSALDCEINLFRYRPFERALIRGSESDSEAVIARMLLAAVAAGLKPELSLPPGREFAVPGVALWHESEEALCRRLGAAAYGVLRTASPTEAVAAAAIEAGVRLVGHVPVSSGKLELPVFFREQAISETRHRHGSVLPRPEDLR